MKEITLKQFLRLLFKSDLWKDIVVSSAFLALFILAVVLICKLSDLLIKFY